MHRSRFSGYIIDCQTGEDALPAVARFWGEALGFPVLREDGPRYQILDASARDLIVEVQAVAHESRVHLDIETDDIEAEVQRLEGLGARRVEKVRSFWVMQAPSGQRFCVVQARNPLEGLPGTRSYP
jgi:hypothetical protein